MNDLSNILDEHFGNSIQNNVNSLKEELKVYNQTGLEIIPNSKIFENISIKLYSQAVDHQKGIFVGQSSLSSIVTPDSDTGNSLADIMPSKKENQFIQFLIKFSKSVDKNVPWESYFFPVHVTNGNVHGVFSNISQRFCFVSPVLQFLISIEKAIKSPLTAPNHPFRCVFDNYGISSNIEVIHNMYTENNRNLRKIEHTLVFFQYFMSMASIPNCMKFDLYGIVSSSGLVSNYYLKVNLMLTCKSVSGPPTLTDILR